VAFSRQGVGTVLVAAPLVSLYFTVLLFYSYRQHRLLARYLREVVEPALAARLRIAPTIEWELWYAAQAFPRKRYDFFFEVLWIICVSTPIYLFVGVPDKSTRTTAALALLCTLYIVGALWATRTFWSDPPPRSAAATNSADAQ
jgi:hypothetical protein